MPRFFQQKQSQESNIKDLRIAKKFGLPFMYSFLDVESYVLLKGHNNAEDVINRIKECYDIYETRRLNLVEKASCLKIIRSEITNCKEMLNMIEDSCRKQRVIRCQCKINEGLYVPAVAKPNKCVFLELGANVLMEFTLNEADAFLRKKKRYIRKELWHNDQHMKFVAEQQAMMTVNMARVHNWEVIRKSKEKEFRQEALSVRIQRAITKAVQSTSPQK